MKFLKFIVEILNFHPYLCAKVFYASILCYSTPAPKIPLKDLASMSQGSSGTPVIQSPTVSTVTHPPPVSAVSGSTTTTVTTPTKAEIQPLTDIFVELDKIQPGKSPVQVDFKYPGNTILNCFHANTPPVSAVSGSTTTIITTPSETEIQPITEIFIEMAKIHQVSNSNKYFVTLIIQSPTVSMVTHPQCRLCLFHYYCYNT